MKPRNVDTSTDTSADVFWETPLVIAGREYWPEHIATRENCVEEKNLRIPPGWGRDYRYRIQPVTIDGKTKADESYCLYICYEP